MPPSPAAEDAAESQATRAALANIESALRAQNYDSAIHAARTLLRDQKLSVFARAQVNGSLTIAFCGQQDLGGARSHFERIPARRTRIREQVRKFCGGKGIDL